MPLAALLLLTTAAVPATRSPPDCDDLYYGIDQPKDRQAAYACYAAQSDFPMRILMLLDGDGVPVDLAKAQAVFREWEKVDRRSATESLQAEALRKTLTERQARPDQAWPPLDFCADIAGDTINVNRCAAIEQRKARHAATAELAATKAKLPPAAAKALEALAAAFSAFREAEGKRAYQEYAEGTIRNIAAIAQEQAVETHFMQDIKAVVGDRQLPSGSEAALKAAAAELDKASKAALAAYAAGYDALLKDASFKDQWPAYRQGIADYNHLVQAAGGGWTAYRDAWPPLVRALYGGDPGKSTAILTIVTQDRCDELTSDPVGGD